ncbi:MAG: hypothetical protein COS08_01545 [Euryarchaeota archaeon CG01_land_8_20_14_3_00_38_12]|nr:MAG: hypothetical protein COS08_01545 [Euryarchaeota archaeon CG01_land_8_20_14_3_00_38_12]
MSKDRFFSFFTTSFFTFLLSYLLIKFFLVFFFYGSASPSIVFQFTPFHLLKLRDPPLLILSIIVIGINTYLHFHDTRMNLIYSLLPTGLMVAGLGAAAATLPFSSENLLYYLLLSLLLMIMLMDHNRILRMPAKKELSPRRQIEHALYQRGTMLSKMAVEAFDKLESKNPEYENLFPAKALAYALLGDYEQAMKYWEEARKAQGKKSGGEKGEKKGKD